MTILKTTSATVVGNDSTTSYHVLNENTLGYIKQERPNWFGVLAGKPQLGGHDWKNGDVFIGRLDVIRPATLVDFDFYRVCPPPAN